MSRIQAEHIRAQGMLDDARQDGDGLRETCAAKHLDLVEHFLRIEQDYGQPQPVVALLNAPVEELEDL